MLYPGRKKESVLSDEMRGLPDEVREVAEELVEILQKRGARAEEFYVEDDEMAAQRLDTTDFLPPTQNSRYLGEDSFDTLMQSFPGADIHNLKRSS